MSINQRLMLAATLAALSACVSAPPPPPKPDLTPKLTPLNPDTKASFECAGALPDVHRQICASDALALQDKDLAVYLHKLTDRLDLPGALVLEVARGGTILLAHDGTSRGRVTFAMNLKQRHEHAADSGEVLNAFLRRKSQQDPARARYLAGELWRGFGRPVSEKPRGTR